MKAASDTYSYSNSPNSRGPMSGLHSLICYVHFFYISFYSFRYSLDTKKDKEIKERSKPFLFPQNLHLPFISPALFFPLLFSSFQENSNEGQRWLSISAGILHPDLEDRRGGAHPRWCWRWRRRRRRCWRGRVRERTFP